MRKRLPRRVLLLPVTGMLSGALLAMSFTLPMSQGESEPTIAKGPVRTPAPPLAPPAPPHPNELPGPAGFKGVTNGIEAYVAPVMNG